MGWEGGKQHGGPACSLICPLRGGEGGGAETTVAPRCGATEMVTWPEFITHAVGFWVCLGVFLSTRDPVQRPCLEGSPAPSLAFGPR